MSWITQVPLGCFIGSLRQGAMNNSLHCSRATRVLHWLSHSAKYEPLYSNATWWFQFMRTSVC